VDIFHTISHGDLGVFALGLLLAGAVSGLAAGALGISGGIVIVPVLYHVMTALGIVPVVRMHVAIATSLAAMLPAALARAQNSKNDIDWTVVLNFAAPLVGGIVLGSAAAESANGHVLAMLFALVAVPIVFHLLAGERGAMTATPQRKRTTLTVASLCAFVSALTGIAPDTIRMSMPGVRKMDSGRERATAAVLAVIAAVAGAIAFAVAGWNARDLPPDSLGYVNLLGFALIAPVLLATEPAGAALAHMMDLRRLRLVFAGLIVISTARMLWDAFV
jgi:uncharacterized membrane protein YfcA